MTLYAVDTGEVRILEWIIANELKISLTTLEFTQADTLTYSSFSSHIPTTEGGEHKTLTADAWTVSPTTGTVAATYDSQLTWTCTGDTHTYYGYIVWDDAAPGDTLLWTEKWAAGEATYNGKLIKLTPYIELD